MLYILFFLRKDSVPLEQKEMNSYESIQKKGLGLKIDILVTLTIHISHFWQSAAAVLVHKFFLAKD